MGKWRYGQRKQEHGQHKRPASFVSRISTYAISSTLSLSFRFASFVPFFLRFLRAWHRHSPLSNLLCLHPPRVLHVPDFGSVIWCPVFPGFVKPISAYPLGVLVLLNPPPLFLSIGFQGGCCGCCTFCSLLLLLSFFLSSRSSASRVSLASVSPFTTTSAKSVRGRRRFVRVGERREGGIR